MKTGVRSAEYAAPGDIVIINDRCSLFSGEFSTGWKMNGEPGDVCLVLRPSNPKIKMLRVMHPKADACYIHSNMLRMIDG